MFKKGENLVQDKIRLINSLKLIINNNNYHSKRIKILNMDNRINNKNNPLHFLVKEMKNFNSRIFKETIWIQRDLEIQLLLKIPLAYKDIV